MKPCFGFFFIIILKDIAISAASGIRILNLLRNMEDNMLQAPETLQDIPLSEPIMPGHVLINPSPTMLKSASKFPSNNGRNVAVYGNLDNVGVSFDDTGEYILYTGFRKTSDVTTAIIKKLQEINEKNVNMLPVVIALEKMHLSDETNDDDNSLENLSNGEENWKEGRGRRAGDKKCGVSESSDSDTDHETNPGNPYTIFKNKYKQNWPWNFEMDGDHMNINPLGPKLTKLGPSGADLFFGRKWWYFNQDDYLPLG